MRAYRVGTFLWVTVAVALGSGLNGQDLKLYVFGKSIKYEQSADELPVLDGSEPFGVTSAVLGTAPGEFDAISVTPPGGVAIVFGKDGGNWGLDPEPRFGTKAALDVFAPDSADPYVFSFTPGGGGSALSGPLVLNGGSYPSAPHVVNLTLAGRIDADSDFTLVWEGFSDGTADDFIILSIGNEMGGVVETPPPPLDGSLAGTATSYLIPAGSFEPGKTYRCELQFFRSIEVRTTDLPNLTGRSFYSARTSFQIHTTPFVSQGPESHVIIPGQPVLLSVDAEGTGDLEFQWRKDGTAIPGATSSILYINAVDTNDAGSYDVELTDSTGQIFSEPAVVEVDADAVSSIVNLSNRSQVLSGSGIMIPGFVIAGTGNKSLLVRAIGPSLEAYGVTGFLTDPYLALFDGDAAVNTNDDWGTSADVENIRSFANQLSAFALPEGSRDAVLIAELAPGRFTVQASGVDDGTGVALVELYDADAGGPAELINISNRGYVGVGAESMIPGFVISGYASKTVLIRVVGPSLARYGLSGLLEDPVLRVFRGGQIAENDDWQASPVSSLIGPVGFSVGAFDLDDGSADAAILMTLQPGAYTVQATGAQNSVGKALVEVYVVQ